ncbi:MAG: HAMP domain-containing sensor histidine kinase [Tunicatimonas sp.]|uniref:sensor histidine kinase n=1 Tax=Tunicatimonas sp. TaxID=1940096 RepID=UPI003C71195C
MKNIAIRWVVAFGIIAVLGIVAAQSFWVIKIRNAEEQKLNQQIYVALKNAAAQLADHYQNMTTPGHPVKQISEDYYVVEINDMVDAQVLEHYLKNALIQANVMADFEYAVYDCRKNQMVYGNRVSILNANVSKRSNWGMPLYKKYTYYFGVYFPNKSSYVFSEMDTWFMLSAVLLLVILFFGYTLLVILRQKRWSELQKDFINNMTHEFKTPIATINVSADVLQTPSILDQPQRLQNYAQIIKEQSLRLNGQVEKVLQVAKLEQRALGLHPETLDLVKELDNICAGFRAHYEGQILLTTNFDNKYTGIAADPMHFRNVIQNLLDNAVKYSDSPAEILLRTEQRDNKVHVVVEDQGRGIPSEYLTKVFHKFVRVPTGNQHNVKGFGLGLYYVKRICQLHRWKIEIQSELGKGTQFTIGIPLTT